MTATQLKADLDRLGIQLVAHGDRLRYCPQSAVTPDLAHRMKAQKAQLLAILRSEATCIEVPDEDPFADWIELARPDGSVSWVHPEHADDGTEVDPPDPCPQCGGLDLWQSVASDLYGLPPGTWRCLRCDPPTTARQLQERAKRIKLKTAQIHPELTQSPMQHVASNGQPRLS